MKPFLFFAAVFICSISKAQITNTREGLWEDNTLWSGNIVPTADDDVLLNFDITVAGNAFCRSLNANGHNVTVNTGANLTIAGGSSNYADTLFSRFLSIDTSGAVPDTVETWDFYYDSLKRLAKTMKQEFESGLTYKLVREFNYDGSSRQPYYVSGYSYSYSNNDSFYSAGGYFTTFENGRLVYDSSLYYLGYYSYLPGAIAVKEVDRTSGFISYDTTNVEYDANGNITLQLNHGRQDSFIYVYDTHPNPFYQYNLFTRSPFYLLETFLEEVIAKNNMLQVRQYNAGNPGYKNGHLFEYNAQGYPVRIWGYDLANPGEVYGGYGVYMYTH